MVNSCMNDGIHPHDSHSIETVWIDLCVIEDIAYPYLLYLRREFISYMSINLRVYLTRITDKNESPVRESLHQFTYLLNFMVKSSTQRASDRVYENLPRIFGQEIFRVVIQMERPVREFSFDANGMEWTIQLPRPAGVVPSNLL